MKNERTITHFQSYTTAQGCVKELTTHFDGRISVAAVKNATEPQNERETPATGAAEIWDDIAEVGGIALGTVADLIPGFGPVFSGGPVVGAIVGDVFGDYMAARGHLNHDVGDADDSAQQATPAEGTVYVAVDVANEEEMALAEHIMRQHGGDPHRVVVGDFAEPSVETFGVANEATDATILEGADAAGAASFVNPSSVGYLIPDEPNRDYADGAPQPTGQERRRVPSDDGFTLDPIPPYSPSGWIDPNIGVGDLELVDPTIATHEATDVEVEEANAPGKSTFLE